MKKTITRRTLIPQDKRAAGALLRLVRASGRPGSWYAAELGVSSPAFQQWVAGQAVVPVPRVAQLSALLECDPCEISVQWRETVAPFLSASHSARLDPNRLETLIATVDSAAAGQRLPISPRLKARLVTKLYESGSVPDSQEFVRTMLETVLSAVREEQE